MVERIEHLGAGFQLHSLSDLEHLDKTKVDVPVTRSGEDIASSAILSGRRNTKGLRWINAASQRVDRLEQHWTSQRRIGEILQLGFNRLLHSRTSFVATVGSECAAADCKWLTAHLRVDCVDRPSTKDLVNEPGGRTQEASSPSHWYLPNGSCSKDMRAIKVRTRSFLAEVANISGRARIRSRKAATRRRPHRIDRLVVNRLAKGVRHTHSQPVAEATAQSKLGRVIV